MEGYSRLTYELEPVGEWSSSRPARDRRPQSRLIDAVSSGWPLILASLKSLLETGESLAATRQWPEGV